MRTGLTNWRCLALALAGLISAAPAAGAEPIYFHKPNVDRDAFVSDYGRCEELARGVDAPPPVPTYSADVYAMAANSFFNGFFRSRGKRHMVENVLRTCMADKGYRRVRASKQVVRDLNRLPEREKVDRLFVLAAAPVAEGEIMPR